MKLPEFISTETELECISSIPSEQLVSFIQRLSGDIMILGIAGKMGTSLGMTAVRDCKEANVTKKVIGVARFSEPGVRENLEKNGISTIFCDLMDRQAVSQLPKVKNIIFMAGRKFGTEGNQELTWAINILVPQNVAEHFNDSRIVAFSTGCVYPLVPVVTGGCTEDHPTDPLGEYSQSCLGRERIFSYYSNKNGTPICHFRLNYAIDLRYGVLHDIASKVFHSEPVDLTIGFFNAIWQGDACNQALLSFDQTSSPPNILNITGPETISTRWTANEFGKLFNKNVIFAGTEGPVALLNNSTKATQLFGYPSVTLHQMIQWTADWLTKGGRTLNKPTHFEINNGRF